MTNNQLTGERLTDSDLEDLICELEAAGFYRRQLTCLVELQECRKVNADLTMWVKRLGYSLKNAKPVSKLPSAAMAYLSAKGLVSVEDILR
ncbi:hypothetical protein [Klebsiella aerogenes]|uniref:hypothetical protein n=1 Tax=Klebsiella aerogenes TaxID=548 RepID=UPI00062C22D5|nr:hypothetical protein [Klebsiella aerogenes]KKY64126.1 hypothetical protein OA41_20265 [Klebsiella aerogenes]